MVSIAHVSIPNLKDKSVIQHEQQKFKIEPVHRLDVPFETATFGMGCFWGSESLYGATKGIIRTTVGYSGGTKKGPKYRDLGDHVEVLEIEFDPSVVSYSHLLDLFWNNHEYGLTNNKIKRQYMSLIQFHSEEQRQIAEASRVKEQQIRKNETIITEISAATTFYPAEDYHQKYRLQGHKELCASLGVNSTDLLKNSFVATKLNGYLVGVGGVEQFLSECDKFGITPTQKAYIKHYVEKNEGSGLFC